MSWLLLAFALILLLPLAGALLALLVGRFLPKRAGLLIAAVPLFLASVAIFLLVQFPLPSQVLGPTQTTPAGMEVAPTSHWVQAPRTLVVTVPVSPTATPTPTLVITPTATPHPFSRVTIVVRNGTKTTGLATRTTKRLQGEGFRVLDPEDDDQAGNRPHTLILDRGDHSEVRQALATYLNVSPEYIQVNSDTSAEADIVVIVGDDFETLSTTTPVPTPTLVGGPTATPNPHAGATVVVRNGTLGRSGLATRTTERLRKQGFQVIEPEDDDRAGIRPHTLILDRGDHSAVRQALADFLQVAPEYIQVNSSEPSAADIIVILGDDYEE
jgi:hypothetical protein